MIEQAIEKIRDEMAKSHDNAYVQVVGDYLLQHLTLYPECADKIMTNGKTLAGSLDDMRKEAQKQKNGNVAVLTDAQGFAVVLGYFGIKGKPAVQQPAPQTVPAVPDFNVSLDDFLL